MTQYSLSELARLVDGQLHGDGDTVITGADTIRDAGPGEITLADSRKLATDIDACQAAAVVTSNGFAPTRIPYITVENVHDAFTKIVSLFRPHHHSKVIGVSAAAVVSPTARLGHNVTVHPNAVIGDDVEIESGTTIHSGAQIMAGCKIGADTVIFPNVVLYENSLVGDRCIIHSGVMVGAFGFGYSTVEGKHQLSAQMGFVRIGNDVEIGANTTIDRGTYGATVIGDGTKIDNQVQIAHNCRIGRHNILCSQVGIAGSTTTGDYVVMGGQVGVRDHVHIGDGARLGAKAGVMTNIPAGGAFVGIPATPERDQMMIQASLMKLPKLKKQIRELTKTVDELEHANPFRSQNEAA